MDKKENSSGPRGAVDQALGTATTGRCIDDNHGGEGPSPPSAPCSKVQSASSTKLDSLMMINVSPKFSYRALHTTFKTFGTVMRIRLIYDGDSSSNRCYVTFAYSNEAKLACEAAPSLPLAGEHFKAKLLSSCNIAETDDDYVPNIFADAKETTPRVRQVPTPRWFVAYYRNGRGNFIHTTRYLTKEIGLIPQDNLKKYGKGVLIKAKDLTQANMLAHLPCPPDGIFESIKPHRTFNYTKGCVYNQDLYEFSEEEILGMCPDTVHKVTKMRGSSNMIILTFHGSSFIDRIWIGPLNLSVKHFIDRPLQCYKCYGYGHGKNNCNQGHRCGNCSALDSHLTTECDSDPYCFHCRETHAVRSRNCPKYRQEQDILHLANTRFISLGSARRELLFRQGKGGAAKSYASSLASRPLNQPTHS